MSALHPSSVKRLRNGAEFQYQRMIGGTIHGRYKDYTGEWVDALWYGDGLMIGGPPHAEFNLDWDQ